MSILVTTTGRESIVGATPVSLSVNALDGKRISLAGFEQFGARNSVSAGRGLKKEIAGEWTYAGYSVPDDTILRVVGQRGGQHRYLFIRVDDRAPRQRIKLPTSGNARSAIPMATVEGNFWFITPGDALPHVPLVGDNVAKLWNELGATPYEVFAQSEELMTGQKVPIIETKTVTLEGEDVQVPTQKRRRALRL